jgi:selenide, water dikinase
MPHHGAAMKNLERRKRVIERSMRLGHCICDVAKSCPCDVLREKDVCLCAGERLDGHAGPVRLMNLVRSAGCASKIDQATLGRVLQGLPFLEDPRVLVGAPAGDDAGVYRLDDSTALVQTVDVFTPSVDDPYTFGQIAAANSLSDVYAMGGRPITALSIVGFPLQAAPEAAMHQILRGGLDKMAEAGVAVVGGHSINDEEIKAGFAVTGLVHPERIVTNAGARPGDCLILTKPLGTGIMAFAMQLGRAPAGGPEAAAHWMAMLNQEAAKLMVEFGVRACTDVTGFGLAGHLAAMAEASRVDVEVVWDDLPLLPGVMECLAEGIASGAVERNRESSASALVAGDGVTPPMLDLCFDPQTSGGLLLAVAPSAADELLRRLRAAGSTEAAAIGKVLGTGSGRVLFRANGRRQIPALQGKLRPIPATQPIREDMNNTTCCEHGPALDDQPARETGGVILTEQKFREFIEAASAPGALGGKTKRAIAIALSVMARCDPCIKSHVKKARDMGFTREEIDEAAWLGIAFGGSPAMAFYNGVRKALFS